MPDGRVTELAKLALSYCIEAEPGDLVGIQCPVVAEPLCLALYEEILKAGAHPHLMVNGRRRSSSPSQMMNSYPSSPPSGRQKSTEWTG